MCLLSMSSSTAPTSRKRKEVATTEKPSVSDQPSATSEAATVTELRNEISELHRKIEARDKQLEFKSTQIVLLQRDQAEHLEKEENMNILNTNILIMELESKKKRIEVLEEEKAKLEAQIALLRQ